MSSEWWSVLAVFWGLYLADGLRGGRRECLHFYGWFARCRPNGRATQAAWFFIPPAPTAWALTAEDLPASLAQKGITNWPSASSSRPPPLPEHVVSWHWEEIQRVEERAGVIWINGHRFAPSTPALTAAALGTLARELAPLSNAARTLRLQFWHRTRFASARLRRRLRSVLTRSLSLGFLNTVQTLLLATVSTYLLLDGPERIEPGLRDVLARALPSILAVYAVLHLIAVVWFYRLHRRFYPKAGLERASVIFTALFVPPQALRLRLHLTLRLAGGLHPLAVALATLPPQRAQALAADTLRDLNWPRFATNLPADVIALVHASTALLAPEVTAALNRQTSPVSSDSLLTPPVRESNSVCAYCPRCGDQFTRADARCPHGISLVPFTPQTPASNHS
jgi:hypothetical protein